MCNEYCSAAENAMQSDKTDFVANMVRLLPRIYISANDLKTDADLTEEAYIDSALDEDSYESVRRAVETVMGASDTYLEVFEEDMKYSDTSGKCRRRHRRHISGAIQFCGDNPGGAY